MAAAALKDADPEAVLLGKRDLAQALNWSRPTLDRRLGTDKKFPVARRGDQSGGWGFDLGAVRAYLGLGAAAAAPDESDAEDVPAVDTVVQMTRPAKAVHQGEETEAQRLKRVQADLGEDRLRKARGDLIEVGAMKVPLELGLAKLAQALNALPDQLVRRLNLPETARPVIDQEVAETRRVLVAEVRELMALAEATDLV